jgi:hypothetical protein
MTRIFLQQYKLHLAIILFLFIFCTLQFFKPSFLYDSDGSLKQFGLGYRKKTIFPIWLFSIYLGIVCYLIVLIFLKYF